MDKIKEHLKRWIIDYLNNRDLIFRKISSIDEAPKDCSIEVKYKDDKLSKIFILPILEDSTNVIQGLKEDEGLIFACLNTKENLAFLRKNWKQLSIFKKLSIYFINPFSKQDKKWIIHPYTHSKICEDAALKQGLEAMYQTVDECTISEIESILKD